ncbi:hypothetical protein BGZ60DRAFT_535606 [Tricladium varicosporioides]|nr:hypothetical protein BGZ60DRAFT_535606 [Hymenoscyphus varicosporioides]
MGVPLEHIIVGIDIGYTYTGVAIGSTETFNPVPEEEPDGNSEKKMWPKWVQDWPDTKEKVNKVPTSLTYLGGHRRVRSWGFGCPRESDLDRGEIKSKFKFMLDERALPEGVDMDDVRTWFLDYLGKIYKHITDYLARSKMFDQSTSITEYIFSLPTAWENNQQLIDRFEQLIADAGFGSVKNSRARTGLTEAVASAVYTARSVKHKFELGDVVIVCDAGGGTTDVCVLKVAQIDNRTIELEILELPISIHTGSVDIDDEFKMIFQIEIDKLKKDKTLNFVPSKFAAADATHDRSRRGFQVMKEKWGGEVSRLLDVFTFNVSEDPAYREEREQLPEDTIEDSKVKISISRCAIDDMFDRQITKIVEILDVTLENTPQKVSNLILTGGLGSSPYLQSKLIDHFKPRGLRVLIDKSKGEPPLSVCKGLVYDRIQRLACGTSVLRTRRCRASYGILYNKLYSKSKHANSKREIFKDRVDGKKYVRDEIFWFVKKGDEIKDGVPIRFRRIRQIPTQSSEDTWEDTFVVCKTLPPELLTEYLGQGHVKKVAKIVSTSVPNSLSPKRTFPLVGKRFLRGYYEVQATVDEDDIKVQTSIDEDFTGECRFVKVPWEFSKSNEEHEM